MSISDILFSLGLFLTPFMSPKDNPDALFAIGTTESCEAIGFIFIIGIQCLVYYLVFLTYYFMRRVKYKVTPQNFAKKEEKYFHAVFIVLSLGVAVTAAATGSINPHAYGSICDIGVYPEGCDKFDDMVCERGQKGKEFTANGALIVMIVFITLIVILGMFTHHVYRQERELQIPARKIGGMKPSASHHVETEEPNNGEELNEGEKSHEEEEEEGSRDNNNISETKEKNKMVLTKQAFHQSLLYIFAFSMVYIGPAIALFRRKFTDEVKEPEWLFWLVSLVSPLGGVFNILVYTRPKVLKLKETFPDAPYYELLTVIVVSGGEIPSLAELLQATTTERKHREEVQGEEGQFDDDRENLSEQASSKDLISYDLDVSSAAELLSLKKESGQSLFSVIRQRI
ncbi:hypothetical protein CTEN210_01197 [Chaetoceros tenuissimus]|uniref:Uncharacterized protein n=1 Tax=Chaetoceros tenuissimus TaxID=426638 RepID=A0AAD3CF62_9STRA|nr:hypothetical protein CTEN210_01197 [Chaetoceros tenuissimus]